MRIVNEEVELISMTPDPCLLIERCGRVCYKSEGNIGPGTSGPFIAKLIQRGHEAVLEHASATVLIITDRGITHELVRHRLAAYCQESTRYCKYGDEICVIKPSFGMTTEQETTWELAMHGAEMAYLRLLEAGVSPQWARSVLPTCLKTEIVITANMREWRHILKLRTSEAAHPQIRKIMTSVTKLFKQSVAAPCFGDFQ